MELWSEWGQGRGNIDPQGYSPRGLPLLMPHFSQGRQTELTLPHRAEGPALPANPALGQFLFEPF